MELKHPSMKEKNLLPTGNYWLNNYKFNIKISITMISVKANIEALSR